MNDSMPNINGLRRALFDRDAYEAGAKEIKVNWEWVGETHYSYVEYTDDGRLFVHWHEYKCEIPLPISVKHGAEIAYREKYSISGEIENNSEYEMFKAGFDAARRIK